MPIHDMCNKFFMEFVELWLSLIQDSL